MIETIFEYSVPAAFGLFRLIVILIFIIGLIRFYNAVNDVSYNKETIFNKTFQSIAAAILIAGSMITLAIIYLS